MSSPESWKEWEGRVIAGRHLIPQWLGGSEYSAVFVTQRPGYPSQKAAIKLIAADANAERHLARWRAAAHLAHPNLIQVFESGRCQMEGAPLLYVVMEYAEEDLSQIFPQRPLAPAEAADLLPPLLDALSYLHEKGLIHGRLKPSNVLAAGDQVKLSADQVTSSAGADARQGRRDVYDAPETAGGVISTAGDMWSLGITLVAALTQKPPSADEAQAPSLPESLPEPFRGIVRECLHLDPRRRCSIAQVLARLQPPARSVPAPMTPPQAVKHYRYGWRVLIPLAVLLVFGLGIGLFHKFFPSKVPRQSGEFKIEVAPPPSSRATTPQPARPARSARMTQGEVLHQVIPDVPQSARDTITGTIRVGVRAAVDSSGKVTAVELASPGPSKYFAKLALKAAQGWEFTPSKADGRPAASVWLLHFRFRRDSTQAAVERVLR